MDLLIDEISSPAAIDWRTPLPFVGFAGVFVAIMRMPHDYETVVIHAWLQGTHVMLKKGFERAVEKFGTGVPDSRANDPRHYRMNLHRMLLLEDGAAVDEGEKLFKISRVTFGKHVLVPMSEVNAMDAEGNDIKLMVRKHFNSKDDRNRYLNHQFCEAYCHATLVNEKQILMATRDKDTLTDITVIDVSSQNMMQEMDRMLSLDGRMGSSRSREHGAKWSPVGPLDFLDRFLYFVRNLLTNRRIAPGRVISFRYCKGRTHELKPRFQSPEASENIMRVC